MKLNHIVFVLSSIEYPKFSLKKKGTRYSFCLEENPLSRIFKNQITTLNITLAKSKTIGSISNKMNVVCKLILTIFNSLRCLKFYPYSDVYICYNERLSFSFREPRIFFSSNLMELHINVCSFTDCLYLLDGRFKQLHTLCVNVDSFRLPSEVIINKVDYLN
jgi:hypothetical protein